MPATLTVRDEALGGQRSDGITLEFPTERITVRELIRERVYQEVQDYNTRLPDTFRGLVQPEDYEWTLNGYRKLTGKRQIDWKEQFESAIKGFEASQILVLVNDRQCESLDETIELTRGTEVTFLKLMPLVGG